MRSIARRLPVLALPALLGGTACLPYTVGSTAQTVPTGKTTTAMSYYFIPNAVRAEGDTIAVPMAGIDREWRHGMSERSDFGVRLTAGSGAVVNYKRRIRDVDAGGPAVAYMVGAGIVNWGEHAHFEATLVASGDERASVTPFGGVRAMQVAPISLGAPTDSPTLGVFGGVQLGDGGLTIRPELGVFYDRSTLGLRSSSFIVVPAITIQRRNRRDDFRVRQPVMGGAEHRGDRVAGGVGCGLLGCPRRPSRGSAPVMP